MRWEINLEDCKSFLKKAVKTRLSENVILCFLPPLTSNPRPNPSTDTSHAETEVGSEGGKRVLGKNKLPLSLLHSLTQPSPGRDKAKLISL